MASFNPSLEETQKAGLFTLCQRENRRKRGCMLILKTPYQKGRLCFFFVDPSRKLSASFRFPICLPTCFESKMERESRLLAILSNKFQE